MKSKGTHIIIDMYKYDKKRIVSQSIQQLMQKIIDIVEQNELTVVGSTYKIFSTGAFTAAILLAESHVTVHTWPELDYVSSDIFVCNYKKDNSEKAVAISRAIIDCFKPKIVHEKKVARNI